MEVLETALAGVLVFRPQPHHDVRGFFTRTFDAGIAAQHGVDSGSFRQDSQSRSRRGTVRGMHTRSGLGEAKLVRCARGAVHDVVVDVRIGSPTFGLRHEEVLDDVEFRHLYVPPGFLHGFQSLTEQSDVCYRIDREHDPAENLSVRFDDPELAIAWPEPVEVVSDADRGAGTWAEFLAALATRGIRYSGG
jgi:dTDP-4-dehydrorhamnose 3,5-epimerase